VHWHHAPRMGEFPTRDDGVIRVTGMRGNGAIRLFLKKRLFLRSPKSPWGLA